MSIELDLPRELDSAAKARQAIDQLVGRLAEEQLGDVRLLVSELVTNSLRHGGLSAQDRIRLGVLVSAELVRVEVTDPGTGFAFHGPADDPDTVEGWGLYLVATLADRWGIERNGPASANCVWFELDRAPELPLAG